MGGGRKEDQGKKMKTKRNYRLRSANARHTRHARKQHNNISSAAAAEVPKNKYNTREFVCATVYKTCIGKNI